jgi:hypothetical protein
MVGQKDSLSVGFPIRNQESAKKRQCICAREGIGRGAGGGC